jgi:hypothetical protein
VLKDLKHYEEEYSTLSVYGGVDIQNQIYALNRGVDIFVGTTGRVLDLMERGNIDYSDIKSVILDEADQMLKLGFKEDVEKVKFSSKLDRSSNKSRISAGTKSRFACSQQPCHSGSIVSPWNISTPSMSRLILPRISITRLLRISSIWSRFVPHTKESKQSRVSVNFV